MRALNATSGQECFDWPCDNVRYWVGHYDWKLMSGLYIDRFDLYGLGTVLC
jgi:hypothetical protein